VRHVGLTRDFLPETDDPGTGGMTLLRQLMRSDHYRPHSPHLIANGGTSYFDDDAEWLGYRDLRLSSELVGLVLSSEVASSNSQRS